MHLAWASSRCTNRAWGCRVSWRIPETSRATEKMSEGFLLSGMIGAGMVPDQKYDSQPDPSSTSFLSFPAHLSTHLHLPTSRIWGQWLCNRQCRSPYLPEGFCRLRQHFSVRDHFGLGHDWDDHKGGSYSVKPILYQRLNLSSSRLSMLCLSRPPNRSLSCRGKMKDRPASSQEQL